MNSIIISADIYPTKSNEDLFIKGNIDELFGKEIIDELKSANVRIFNLEGPFTNVSSPIKKSGPNHIAKIEAFNAISMLKPTILSLANNHILDQDENGLRDTLEVCKKNGINYCGIISKNSSDKAYQDFVLNGKKIAVYSCAEHEFSVANEKHDGANPYDPLVAFDDVKKLKEKYDYVIVLYHGGREEYRFPTPQIRRIFHKFSDYGADIVINQHSHCIGSAEEYNDSTLVYGQGNFLFDADDNEYWNSGLLIKLKIKSRLEVEYIPIVKVKNKVRLASKNEKKMIIEDFTKRSRDILKDRFVESNYNEYVEKLLGSYLASLHGKNKMWRVLNKLTRGKVWKFIYRDFRYYTLLNTLRCESHYELVRYGLEKWK